MSPNESILVGADIASAARLAADRVVDALAGPGAMRAVALAGGATPAALYRTLTQAPWRGRIDWPGIEWFWGDERTVPPDHPDSNYRFACETLLQPLGIDPARVHRMTAEAADLDLAAAQYEQTIRAHLPAHEGGIPVLDLVLLGIGTDGHTASLFPGSPALAERHRLVVVNECPLPAEGPSPGKGNEKEPTTSYKTIEEPRASARAAAHPQIASEALDPSSAASLTHSAQEPRTSRPPDGGTRRLTMTYPLLRAARTILFFVTGSAKARVLADILAPEADPMRLPAAALRDAPGRIVWALDAAAAQFIA